MIKLTTEWQPRSLEGIDQTNEPVYFYGSKRVSGELVNRKTRTCFTTLEGGAHPGDRMLIRDKKFLIETVEQVTSNTGIRHAFKWLLREVK